MKCSVDDCGKELKDRTEFTSHSLIAHALIVKKFLQPRPTYVQLHNFFLQPTLLTKAARSLYTSFIRKIARKPFSKRFNLPKRIKNECKLKK